MRTERRFRGISERLARRYLTNLGGRVVDEGSLIEGDSWEATLTSQTVAIGPSLQLNEVILVFEGNREVLEPLIDRFAQKAMRAGG